MNSLAYPPFVSSSRPVSGAHQPMLLLSAPRIAGLLPARVDPPPPPTFSYTNPRLATLSHARHEQIVSSARSLLDAALKVVCGEGSDLELILAQSMFYEA